VNSSTLVSQHPPTPSAAIVSSPTIAHNHNRPVAFSLSHAISDHKVSEAPESANIAPGSANIGGNSVFVGAILSGGGGGGPPIVGVASGGGGGGPLVVDVTTLRRLLTGSNVSDLNSVILEAEALRASKEEDRKMIEAANEEYQSHNAAIVPQLIAAEKEVKEVKAEIDRLQKQLWDSQHKLVHLRLDKAAITCKLYAANEEVRIRNMARARIAAKALAAGVCLAM
jgi:hypothetical protein